MRCDDDDDDGRFVLANTTNSNVFGLTLPELELKIYLTRGEYAKYYTTLHCQYETDNRLL